MTRSALQQLLHVVSRCSRRRISSFGQTMASALVAALPFWGDMKTAELNARFVRGATSRRCTAKYSFRTKRCVYELEAHVTLGMRRHCCSFGCSGVKP